jgi:protein-S-isoprenylcysteine O-methyltransferase Ste14
MKIVSLISLLFLIIFLCAYYLKIWIMKKRFEIKVDVFAKGQKANTAIVIEILLKFASFIGFISWSLSCIFSVADYTFTNRIIPQGLICYIGLLLSGCGVALFISAMIQMKLSWRAGIDKENKTVLITNGVYEISRNPAFVGMDIMFIGAVLSFGNLIMIVSATLLITLLHFQILQEEKYLKQSIGKVYEDYMKVKPRYVLFL